MRAKIVQELNFFQSSRSVRVLKSLEYEQLSRIEHAHTDGNIDC